VMTDKATVEMTSPVAGTVVAVVGEIGGMAAVGSPLVYLQVEGAGNMGGKAAPTPAPSKAPDPIAPSRPPFRARRRPANCAARRRRRGPDPLAPGRAQGRPGRRRQARLSDPACGREAAGVPGRAQAGHGPRRAAAVRPGLRPRRTHHPRGPGRLHG
jgi:2-oxoisovalerate dehydrogenase E2 component (dihydrolipoyl transacylase)